MSDDLAEIKKQAWGIIQSQSQAQPETETKQKPHADPLAIMKYLTTEYAMPVHVAAGILGNIKQESNFNPTAVGDGGKSYGLFQHSGPRKTELQKWAAANNRDVNDWQTQVDFAIKELRDNPKLFGKLLTQPDELTAAKFFSDKFEIPGDPQLGNRLKFAKEIRQLYEKTETAEPPKWMEKPDTPVTPGQFVSGAEESALRSLNKYASFVDPVSAVTGAGVLPAEGIEEAYKNVPETRAERYDVMQAATVGQIPLAPEPQNLPEALARGAGNLAGMLPEFLGLSSLLGPLAGVFTRNYIQTSSGPLLKLLAESPAATQLASRMAADAAVFGAAGFLEPHDALREGLKGLGLGAVIGSLSPLPRLARLGLGASLGAGMTQLEAPEAPLHTKIAQGLLFGTMAALPSKAELHKRITPEVTDVIQLAEQRAAEAARAKDDVAAAYRVLYREGKTGSIDAAEAARFTEEVIRESGYKRKLAAMEMIEQLDARRYQEYLLEKAEYVQPRTETKFGPVSEAEITAAQAELAKRAEALRKLGEQRPITDYLPRPSKSAEESAQVLMSDLLRSEDIRQSMAGRTSLARNLATEELLDKIRPSDKIQIREITPEEAAQIQAEADARAYELRMRGKEEIRKPLEEPLPPPFKPAKPSAEVLEHALAAEEQLRQSPLGKEALKFELATEQAVSRKRAKPQLTDQERMVIDRALEKAEYVPKPSKGVKLFSGIPIDPDRVYVRFQELKRAGKMTLHEILDTLESDWQASPGEIATALKQATGQAASIPLPRVEVVDSEIPTLIKSELLKQPDVRPPHIGKLIRRLFGGKAALTEQSFEMSWKTPLSWITESPKAEVLKRELYWPISRADTEAHKLNKIVDQRIKQARKDYADVDLDRVFNWMEGRTPEGRQAVEAMGRTVPDSLTPREMELVNWFDDHYKAMLPLINDTLVSIGKEPIQGIDGYIPLMRRLDDLRQRGFDPVDIDPMYLHPNSPQFNALKERIKIPKEFEIPIYTDPFEVFQHYMHNANRFVKFAPWVKTLRDIVKKQSEIVDPDAQEAVRIPSLQQTSPNLAKYMDMWADNLAGIQNSIRTPFDTFISRLTRNFVTSELGFRILSFINQSGAMVFTAAKTDPVSVANGFIKALSSIERAKAEAESLKIASRRYDLMANELSEAIISRRFKNLQHSGFVLLELFDHFISHWGFQSLKDYALKRGMSYEEAVKYADEFLTKTHGGSMYVDKSPIQSSAIGKLLTAFQTFTINEFNFVARDILGIANPHISNKEVMASVVKLVTAALVYNALLTAVGIKTPVADPISAYQRTVATGEGPGRFLVEMMKELMGHVPVYGSLAYGKVPFGAVGSAVTETIKNPSQARMVEVFAQLRGIPGIGQLRQLMLTEEGQILRWKYGSKLPYEIGKHIMPTGEKEPITMKEAFLGREQERVDYDPVLLDKLFGF